MHLIDRNAQTNRFRTVPAVEKLGFALGSFAVALGTHSFYAEGALLVLALVLIRLAGVPFSDLRVAAQVPIGFILIGCVTQATSVSLADWPPHLAWTRGGIEAATFVGMRSLACVSVLLALALTTPISDILRLMRRSVVGRDIGDIAFVMLKMVWVTLDCLDKGARSQANRLGFVGYRRTVSSLGSLLAALLPRTLGRARRMEIGLAARGFEGDLRFVSRESAVSPARVTAVCLALASIWGLGQVAP